MRHFQKEKTLAVGAVGIMFLMFSNGYTWYLSLSKTPVSVNTAIYNCVSVWIFFFFETHRQEKKNIQKLISKEDSQNSNFPFLFCLRL